MNDCYLNNKKAYIFYNFKIYFLQYIKKKYKLKSKTVN